MTKYMFLETRDPFESRDVKFVEETAIALHDRGHEVTVFLLQNGVLAARRDASDSPLARLAKAGVTLLADDFSLCERGIKPEEMFDGVRPSSIESLVDMLVEENTKAIWH